MEKFKFSIGEIVRCTINDASVNVVIIRKGYDNRNRCCYEVEPSDFKAWKITVLQEALHSIEEK